MSLIRTLPERFRRRITVDKGGCWLWGTPKTRDGYGQISWKGRMVAAHRVVKVLLEGEFCGELDHLCRVRNCVNPAHLEPVSHRENTMRGDTITAAYAARNACKHGHPFTPNNTRMRGGARVCLECKRARGRQYMRNKRIKSWQRESTS